ncbi:MAG: hypothetical protein A2138_08825 [Deltaproteobacteria bacterium RBG_16_71_12]|nr:MAG: hypothetical protein A2138_08825 [Deltaproteobacteria bacterium RBG_16_71_12]
MALVRFVPPGQSYGMRVEASADRVDVTFTPWIAWGSSFLLMLIFAPLGAPLVVFGPIFIAALAFVRARRWRFDRARGDVRFARGLFPCWLRPYPTLAVAAGEDVTFAHLIGRAGTRLDRVALRDIERALLATSVDGRRQETHALALQLKDGSTVEFGIGQDTTQRWVKQRAVDAINALLVGVAAPPLPAASVDAESFGGSPVAVPSLVDDD